MFGANLVLGARSITEVEQAVRSALDDLDLCVVDEAAVRRQDGVEAPTLALGVISEASRAYTLHIRGPRSPLWHLALAQRLSLTLGGWSASQINDRLYSEYGYGFFLAGHAIEGGVRTISRLVARFGIDPRVTDAQFYDALDEDVNTERFKKLLTRVADDRAMWSRGEDSRVLFVATKTGESMGELDSRARRTVARHDHGELPWLVLSAAPRLIGTLAGLAANERVEIVSALAGMGVGVEAFEVDPSYDVLPDGSIDEAPISVLLFSARSSVRAADVLDALAYSACPAAVIELGAQTHAWARPAGLTFVRVDTRGVDALARAWDHVTERTALRASRWTFPATVAQSPFR